MTRKLLDTSPPKQFIATREAVQEPNGFSRRSFDTWNICLSKDVPCIDVLSEDGRTVGLIIGWIIENDGTLGLHDKIVLSGDQEKSQTPFRAFWGRYLYFHMAGSDVKVSTDAGALFPLVYCADKQVLASSPALLADLTGISFDEEIVREFDLRSRQGWYPFGLTPYRNVRRLLPNHALNLSSFETQRFWPEPESTMFPPENPRAGTEQVGKLATLVQSRIQNLAKNQKIRVHLTAGYDTRMLLAACQNVTGRIAFQTYDLPVQVAKLDSHVAQHLAKKFRLDHRFLPFTETTAEEKAAWLIRTGYCVNDNVTSMAAMEKANFDGSCTLAGISGEVGRAFYWGRDDIGQSALSAETLLNRLRLPAISFFLSAAENWLNTLPAGSMPWSLDLAYIELRLGCWAGAAMPGHDIPHPTLSPFNSIDCYEKMLSLDYGYRVDQRMCNDFIRHLWPELLSVPVNRAVGLNKVHFIKNEITHLLPGSMKRSLKSLKSKLKGLS